MASFLSGIWVAARLRSHFVLFAWVTLLALILSTREARAADNWHILETPRFTIVSQWDEKDTRMWADDFNQYILALRKVIKIDDRLLPHATIVFFSRDKAFRPYIPVDANGKPWNIAGIFSHRETWAVIGVGENYGDENLRHTIFHEGVHWLVSTNVGYHVPLWLNEGLAEVFSTFNVVKNQAQWGDAIGYHVVMLNQQSPMPLERLLGVSDSDHLFNENDRVTSMYYAESWAFVHYLMFGVHRKDKANLSDFLQATSAGLGTDAALKKCFNVDAAGMDGELRRYFKGGSYHIARVPLEPDTKITAPFTPVSQDFVECALAKLALVDDHRDLARKHAETAISLAPNSPQGYDVLAEICQESNDAAGALAASQKAVELGSKDGASYFIQGFQRATEARDHSYFDPKEARKIANLYEQSINLHQNYRLAFLNLAGVLTAVERVADSDDQFLKLGRIFFPDEPGLIIGLAELARKRGKKEDARQMIDETLAHQDALSPNQIKSLQRTERQWTYVDGWNEIGSLQSNQKFADALARLDQLEKEDLTVEQQIPLRSLRRNLVIADKFQTARNDVMDGKVDEARALYEQVLAIPNLQPREKNFAESALKHLEVRRPHAAPPSDEK